MSLAEQLVGHVKTAIHELKVKGEAAIKALVAAVHAEVNRARAELPVVANRLAHDMERELVVIIRGLKAGLIEAAGEASRVGSEAVRVMENGLKEIHTLIEKVAARVREVADKALTEMRTVAEGVANSVRTTFERGLSDAERIIERIVSAVKRDLQSIFALTKRTFVEVKEKIESGFSDLRSDLEGEIHKLESHVLSSKSGGAIRDAFEEAGHVVEVGTATALREAETAGKTAIDGMEDIVKDGSSLINVSTISIAVYYFLAAAVLVFLTNRQVYAASRPKQPSREELLAASQKRAEDIQALAQQIVLAKQGELTKSDLPTQSTARGLFGDIINDALNDVIMPVVNAVMSAVKPVLTAVINELLTLISDIADSALGGLVVSILQDFDSNPNPLQALLADMGLSQIEPLFVNLMANLFDTLVDELGKSLRIARLEVGIVSTDIAKLLAAAFEEIRVVYKTLRRALSDLTDELETVRFLTGRGGSPDSLVSTIETVFEDSLSTVRDVIGGVEDRIKRGLRRMATDLDASYQEVVSNLEQECAKFYGDFQRIYRETLSRLLAKVRSLTATIRLELQSAERQLLEEEHKLKTALRSRVDVVVDYADRSLDSVGGAVERVGQKVAVTTDRAEGVVRQGLNDANSAIKDVEGWLSLVKIAIFVSMVVFVVAIVFVTLYVYFGARVARNRALGFVDG